MANGWYDEKRDGPLLDFTTTFSHGEYSWRGCRFRAKREITLTARGMKLTRLCWTDTYRRTRRIFELAGVRDSTLPQPVESFPADQPILPYQLEYELDKGSTVALSTLRRIFRDNYQGTAQDLTKGIAAGPFGDPTRYDLPLPYDPRKGDWERPIAIFRKSCSRGEAKGQTRARASLVYARRYAPLRSRLSFSSSLALLCSILFCSVLFCSLLHCSAFSCALIFSRALSFSLLHFSSLSCALLLSPALSFFLLLPSSLFRLPALLCCARGHCHDDGKLTKTFCSHAAPRRHELFLYRRLGLASFRAD